MSAPVIGITSARVLSPYGFPLIQVTEAYVQAVSEAGAIPVLIPLGLSKAALESLLPRLDGILFSGGGDIAPDCYGHDFHPLVDGVDRDRDQVEIELFQDTLQAGLPFLGICRGIQLVNIGLGGTLYEDILDQHSQALQHQYYPNWPRNYLAHSIHVDESSRLGKILRTKDTQVNSLHHQGIEKLASELQVTATAPDGIIEAVELPGYPFGIAVQWHPEWLREDPAMRSLFREFVLATSK